MWPGKGYDRTTLMNWVLTLDIGGVRNIRYHLDQKSGQHAEAQARARAEAEAAEAARKAEAAKLDPKKKSFDILAHLRSQSGKPATPVVPPPSKAEMEDLARKVNGLPPIRPVGKRFAEDAGGKRGYVRPTVPTGIEAQASERELLNARIRVLDPATVLLVYTGGNTKWRWSSTEAMLAVSASDSDANVGLAEFTGRVEKAMAKAKRKAR